MSCSTADGPETNANSFMTSAEPPFVLTTSAGDGCDGPSESEWVRKCMQHKFYIASIQRPGLSTHTYATRSLNWMRMEPDNNTQQSVLRYIVEEITNKSRVK